MKKVLALLLALVMVLSLAGCRSGSSPAGSEAAPDTPQPPVKENGTDVPQLELQQEQEAGTGEEQPETVAADAYEAWAALVGYWNAAEGHFFILDMQDSHSAVFLEGMWDAGGGRGYASITELYFEDGIFTASVLWPAAEATEMNDAMPEQTGSLIIDTTDLEQDGRIRLTDISGTVWQCRYAGATQDEAYAAYLSDQTGA